MYRWYMYIYDILHFLSSLPPNHIPTSRLRLCFQLWSNSLNGKTSQIHHHQTYIFKDIPTPYIATRYHSLVIEEKTIPDCLEIIAETKSEDHSENEIMAIRHKDYHTYGVQFHPESIMSEYGHQILQNFLEMKWI